MGERKPWNLFFTKCPVFALNWYNMKFSQLLTAPWNLCPLEHTLSHHEGGARGSGLYRWVHSIPWPLSVSASFRICAWLHCSPSHYFSNPCLETRSWPSLHANCLTCQSCILSSSPASTTSDFFGVHTSLPLLLLFCSLLWLAAPRALFFLEIFQSSPGFSSSPFFHWSITFTTVSQTHSIQLTSVFPLPLLVNS